MRWIDYHTCMCDICAPAQNCPFAFRPYPFLETSRSSMAWQPRWPTSVPWGLMWPHKAQAQNNHGQSLLRLAERGGLDPVEMLLVIEGRALSEMDQCPLMLVAMERIRAYRIHWLRRHDSMERRRGGARRT